MMKNNINSIIFLDIDGVLNVSKGHSHYVGNGPSETWDYSKIPDYKYGYTSIPFYPKAVNLFNELISITKSKVVIISTWRYGQTIEELQNALFERGVHCTVIDKTIVSGNLKRGEEIQLWLEENGFPDKFCIIDDDYEYDIKEFFPLNGVKPSEPDGFNEKCFQEALDLLV